MRNLLFAGLLAAFATTAAASPTSVDAPARPMPPRATWSQSESPNHDALDGTKPMTLTPHSDATVTVSQEGAPDVTYTSSTLKVRFTGTWPADPPPPLCGASPAPVTVHNECVAGTHGPGWDQTHGWTPAAYPVCWVAAAWVPAEMPADACEPDVVDPPPVGDGTFNYDLSYVDTGSPAFSDFLSFANRLDEAGAMDLILAYKLTGTDSYRQRAIALVDSYVTAALSDIAHGFAPDIAGDSYLYADDPISSIAFVQAWGNPNATQRTNWNSFANQVIFNIWHCEDAHWGPNPAPWSCWAIDNPHNNYYIHFLHLTTAFAIASQNEELLDLLATTLWPNMVDAMTSIDRGGDLEGTGYGYAQKVLFDTYKIVRDSGYGDFAAENTHAANTIGWWVYGTMPTLDRYMPIGDQSRVSETWIYDYQRALIAQDAYQTGDAAMKSLGSWWLTHIAQQHEDLYRANYFDDLYPYDTNAPAPPSLTFRAEQTGLMTGRTSWNTNATFLGVLAGIFIESHAAREQGGFTYFKNDWLAVTNNTWSHSGIEQGARDRNIVRFERNGAVQEQKYGAAEVLEYTSNPATGAFHTKMDMTSLYQVDDNTGVNGWNRTIDFAVGGDVTIRDAVSLASGTTATFQLQVPVHPTISGNIIRAGNLTATVVQPSNVTMTVVDMRTLDEDYQGGWRVDIRFNAAIEVGLHAN